MRRPSLAAVAVTVAVVVTLVAASASTGARPPPSPVVPGEEALGEAGPAGFDPAVASSAATLRVRDDGARWTVRYRLAPATADRLRGDPALARAVVSRATERSAGPSADPSWRLDGDALVVRYDAADAVERALGVTRVTGLRRDAYGYPYAHLGVDRLAVVGPPGTTVGRAPPDAAVDGRRVALTAYDADAPAVAFVPREAFAPGSTATLAAVAADADAVADDAPLLLVLPGALLAGLLAVERWAFGLVGVGRRIGGTDRAARGVAVLGAAVAAHPLYVGALVPALVAGGVGSAVVSAGVGVGHGATARERASTPGRLLALGLLGAAAGAAAAWAAGVAADRFVDPFRAVAPALPALVAPAVGAAADRREAALAGGVVLVAFALAVTSIYAPRPPPLGPPYVTALVVALYAVAVAGLSAPLAALGRGARERAASDADPAPPESP